MRWFIAFVGLARRELLALFSQPRLLAVLVLGPFAILLLFGAGYKNETISLRTAFVVPEGQGLREEIDANQDAFEDYVVPTLFTTDLIEARQHLIDGKVDLVVVFPPNPAETFRAGERVEVAVLHNKLDPIQQAAVDIAAQVAVQEINAGVLTQIVQLGQDGLSENSTQVEDIIALSNKLNDTVGVASDEEVAATATELDDRLAMTTLATATSLRLLDSVQADASTEEERAQLRDVQDSVSEVSVLLREFENDPNSDEAAAKALSINESIQELVGPLGEIQALPAEVIVRPFSHDAESILGRWISPVDFFVPSALALLIQHAGLTFAALTLVRDRDLGVTEHYQVGSTPSSAILLGKALAFVLVGGALSAILIAVVDIGLGVTSAGSIAFLALILGLLLTSSVAVGFCLSALARTDSQAVQYAMLVLLASLFFGGFFLDLDALRYPFKYLSWALPVTYSIRGLQDVMLRGLSPSMSDLGGLAAITVVAGVASWLLLRRETKAS